MIELYSNLRFLEIKAGITHKEQDNYGILSLLLDSWLNERKLWNPYTHQSWYLVCIWVVTHIRMILGDINGKVLKEDKK